MAEYHSLLRRQLKRHFGDLNAVPRELIGLLADIDQAYKESDQDRVMLERSLELSSRELVDANSEMRALFQAIPDVFYRIDNTGTILAMKSGIDSPELPRPSVLIGSRIQDFPEKQIGAQFQDALGRLAVNRSATSIEYTLSSPPNEQTFEARFVPLANDQIVVIVRNITERRSLEQQFRQSQKMEAFGQLAGGVAHDFNNLLTVIQGNVSMVQAGILTPAEARASLEEVVQASERAGNLTRQLLTFSRRQPVQLRPVDLNEIVAGMTKMLQRIIGEHIKLETHYAAGCVPVHTDIGLLEQALLNLAVNARDAMPSGGTLVIETEGVHFNATQLNPTRPNRRAGDFARLSVRDSGIGIAPEHLPHIFEPFFTTKSVGKGTGLGLATVFGVVEQHSGWIEVDSTVGKGSSFNIFLPRLDHLPASTSIDHSESELLGGNEIILLVEDEHSVRILVSRWLSRKGYQVLNASNGPEALELWKLHARHVDLLVTDMVMPDGMSGRELSDRLRAENPDLRVIQCSGYTTDVLDRQSPVKSGVVFLEKPFDRLTFLKVVRSCLDT